MTTSIRTNINAVTTARQISNAQATVDTSMRRLSSGLRLSSAADDAAGLAISEKLKSQINGLNQASRNAKDAVSLIQTAEGALGEIGNMLQRIRTLALQSVNDVNTVSERSSMQKEVAQLQTEITRLANAAEFNGQKLLDGSFQSKRFQVGANSGQEIALSIGRVNASGLGANTVSSSAATDSLSAARTAATDASGVASNRLTAQTLTVTGNLGQDVVTVANGNSARAVAEAINLKTGVTGVTAQAKTAVRLSNLSDPGNVSFTLAGDPDGNGDLANIPSQTALNAQVTNKDDLSPLVAVINERAALTGITASIGENGKKEIILYAEDGRDIVIENFTNADGFTIEVQGLTFDPDDGIGFIPAGDFVMLTSGAAANDSTRIGGYVQLNSSSALNVQVGDPDNKTLFSGANGVNNSELYDVSRISVANIDGASASIGVLDASIQQVNDLRASLGAIQNRLQSTVANLTSSSENLQVSNSRIRDADVAMESAEMARAQVLLQAGISVMAQANQQPQQVLKLLGG